MNTDFSQLFELSIPERIELVEDLWDSISSVPDAVPIPDWQKEELARRKAKFLENPASGVSWETAREEIRRPHE